jgi:hypothetical protein
MCRENYLLIPDQKENQHLQLLSSLRMMMFDSPHNLPVIAMDRCVRPTPTPTARQVQHMAASFSYLKKSYAFYIYIGLAWVMGAVQALEGLTVQTPTPLNRSSIDWTTTTPQTEEPNLRLKLFIIFII